MFAPAGALAEGIKGSPAYNACLRARGMAVGARAFVDTNKLLDYDLISIGDGAAVDSALLLGHLGAAKQGAWLISQKACSVGARATVGPRCVLLPGFSLEDGDTLKALSLGTPSGL